MVSPRESLVQSAYQYDVTSRVGDFQNCEQRVHHCNEFLSMSSKFYGQSDRPVTLLRASAQQDEIMLTQQ